MVGNLLLSLELEKKTEVLIHAQVFITVIIFVFLALYPLRVMTIGQNLSSTNSNFNYNFRILLPPPNLFILVFLFFDPIGRIDRLHKRAGRINIQSEWETRCEDILRMLYSGVHLEFDVNIYDAQEFYTIKLERTWYCG